MVMIMLTSCTGHKLNPTPIQPPIPQIPIQPSTPPIPQIPIQPSTPPIPPTPVPPTPIPPTPKQAGLIGQWVIKCLISVDVPGYYYQKYFSFKNNTLNTINIYHKMGVPGSKTCTLASSGFKAKFETTIVLGKTTSPGLSDEHTDINITTTNVKLMAMDDHHVKMFNDPDWSAGIYTGLGQTDWKINIQKDLSNIPQAIKDFSINKSMPDIFQISTYTKMPDIKLLKMGDKNDDLDDHNRPISLDNKTIAVFKA